MGHGSRGEQCLAGDGYPHRTVQCEPIMWTSPLKIPLEFVSSLCSGTLVSHVISPHFLPAKDTNVSCFSIDTVNIVAAFRNMPTFFRNVMGFAFQNPNVVFPQIMSATASSNHMRKAVYSVSFGIIEFVKNSNLQIAEHINPTVVRNILAYGTMRPYYR